MRWLFRLLMTMTCVASAVYVLFFVDFGGQNLARHLGEVWRSPLVQRKVDVVEKSIEQKVADQLAQTRKAKAASPEGPGAHADDDQISAGDRESLNELVDKIAHSNGPRRLATRLRAE